MKRISVIAISSLLIAGFCLPAHAQKEQYGNSGTITGDDPRSFFGSGANIDPDAMEDASVPVDRATHLDPEYPGQKQIYPTEGTRGASTYPIQLPNRPNVSPGTQASNGVGAPAVDPRAQEAYNYDMAQGNGNNQNNNNNNNKQPKQKRVGFLKWYAQSWKHFFKSSGNILGFPVGTDDDGTGDLKPPDMYGNN